MPAHRVIAGLIAGEEPSSPSLSIFADFVRRNGAQSGEITISSKILGQADRVTKRLSEKSSWAARVVGSVYFRSAIHASIILSALLLGVQAEFASHDDESHIAWMILENFFTLIFVVEMVLKVFVMRRAYFTKSWCVIDFVIACISIADSWVIPLVIYVRSKLNPDSTQPSEANVDLHVFKAFRLMRLSRMLRFLKVVPELRMVVEGLAASLRALSWVTLLLFIVLYAFSIFCVEIVGKAESTYPGYNRTVSIAAFNNYEYFGTLSRSWLSLISVTFLAEWNVIRPVWENQWWVVLVFMAFIFITSFGIVNVIIGVIVERITVSMQQTQVEEAVRHKSNMMLMFESVADKLFENDTDEEGSPTTERSFRREVSREDMRTIAERPDILDLLKHVDFPAGFTFDDLFTMLNVDGVGDVRKTEFLTGMQRLVFGNQFQRTCISHLSLGQIKELIQMLWTDQEQQLGLIRREIAELRSCTTQVLAAVRTQADPHTSPAAAPAAQARASNRPPALSDAFLARAFSAQTDSLASPPPSPMRTCRQWEGRQHVRGMLLSTRHADSPPTMLTRGLTRGSAAAADQPELYREFGSSGSALLLESASSEASLGSGRSGPRLSRNGTPAVHVAAGLRPSGESVVSIGTESGSRSGLLAVLHLSEDAIAEEGRAHEARALSSAAGRSNHAGSSGSLLLPVDEGNAVSHAAHLNARLPSREPFDKRVEL